MARSGVNARGEGQRRGAHVLPSSPRAAHAIPVGQPAARPIWEIVRLERTAEHRRKARTVDGNGPGRTDATCNDNITMEGMANPAPRVGGDTLAMKKTKQSSGRHN